MEKVKKRKPKGYWTKEVVDKKIRERKDAGLSFKPVDVRRDCPGLCEYGKEFYGSWIKAQEAHGIDYRDWYKREPKGYWTKEVVLSRLKDRREQRKSLVPIDVYNDDNKLYQNMARLYEGGIEEVYRIIGEDVEEHRVTWIEVDMEKEVSVNGGLRRPYGYWNKERVKEYIIKRKEQGLTLSPIGVQKKDKGLYTAGVRNYGSWSKALEESGEDPEEWYRVKSFIREESRG